MYYKCPVNSKFFLTLDSIRTYKQINKQTLTTVVEMDLYAKYSKQNLNSFLKFRRFLADFMSISIFRAHLSTYHFHWERNT